MAITKEDLAGMSGPELIEVYNKLNPKYPITKFSSRQKGIDRILDFQNATGKTADLPPKEVKAPKQPSDKPKSAKHPGIIFTMKNFVKRPQGASLEEIGKELKEKFPDRSVESMIRTTRINLNPRFNPEFEITKEKDETRGLVYKMKAKG